MGNFRVEYTITVTVEDGREVAVNKKRVLTQEEVSDVQQIQDYLEREFRKTEQPSFLNEMKDQIGKEITGTILRVDKVTELVPTGDDDQM